MSETKNWYVVYTKPRWEKKVSGLIARKGLEVYCPLNKVRRRWSDRYKVVEEPLFKSYVFVHIAEEDQIRIRLTDGVVNFVYWQGKPAVVRPEEIQVIRRFLKEYEDVVARPLGVTPGQRVRVKTGVLMDSEGLVVKVWNQRVYVQLEALGYELSAQFEKTNLEPVL
ncbi:MAG TPA: UpxY family transcription antiterminator [Lacibacter sp.]|nr:UpxY family transcription antiterminator [Lacibacter sp.]HMO88647.1 UpxY family transcription antiterminator [Lacibacter sp.]HMP85628.1 UpxY family transcription antiterminator [Lacibacter sp.]